jgi:ATP-binding cassette subfamily B protein
MQAVGSERNVPVLRRLLAFSWQYRRDCLAVLGYQGVLLALGLAGLGAVGLAVDVLRHALDPSALPPRWPLGFGVADGMPAMTIVLALGGLVLVMAALRARLNYGYTIAVGRLSQLDIVPTLRARVFDKLQRLDFRFFDANASGSIINRVTGDVQSLRSFIDGVLIQSVVLAMSLAIYVGYMLSKHVALTVACLATTPLLWVGTTLFSRLTQPAYRESRRLSDELLVALSEGIQGLAVLRGFGAERRALERFQEDNRRLREQQHRIFRRVSLFTPSVSLLGQINLVVLLLYGGASVRRGTLSLGDLIVFAGLLQQFSGQVTNLATVVNTLQQSLTGARRVFEVLDAPAAVETPQRPLRPERIEGSVRFSAVDFAYRPGEPVLTGIDFEVRPGERVVVVGEVASGKSTLLALLPRFYDPTAGKVSIDGIDLRELDLSLLRRKIGVVFQETFLFSDTVARNIAFGHPQASQAQIEQAAKLACAHDFIMALPRGYETRVGEGERGLSGGQRQRLALARALLTEPRILLLDDPTAALDPQTEQELFAALETAMLGRTTFIITHRLSTLRHADRILVLEHGRIAEAGSYAELLRRGGSYFSALQQDALDAGLALGGASAA